MQGGMPAEGPGPMEGGGLMADPGAAGPTIIPDDPGGGAEGGGPGPTAGPTSICARAAGPGPISSAAASSATRACVMVGPLPQSSLAALIPPPFVSAPRFRQEGGRTRRPAHRSEEHTSELQSHSFISY